MKKYENVKIEVWLFSQQDMIMASNEGPLHEEIIQEPDSWQN